jgi:MFS-type transporter involved in bile tolerance (Atg22 family)
MTDAKELKRKAIQLIIIFGLVSLFGDILYEGARSVNGPYLKTLAANAAVVGIIGGLGEFIGYALRLISGYFTDKTKAYWFFTVLGYALLVSVPLMALAGIWQVAAVFIIAERLGKGLRAPARDTIVSQATKQIGTGWGFGIGEAMDQIGAMTGPLILTAFFLLTGNAVKTVADYQHAYALFWVPFAMLMLCLLIAYIIVPNPEELEVSVIKNPVPDKLSKVFWLYTAFSFVAAAGLANFVLIGYHFKAQHIFSDAVIPLSYGIAMGVDAIFALLFGIVYDRFKSFHNNEFAGLLTLMIIPTLSIFIPVLAFSRSPVLAMISVVLWGVVMAGHETIMKSAIADLTPIKKRGMGYGIFNTSYGFAMLIGSATMGILYDISIPLVIIFATVVQLFAFPLFFWMRAEALKSGK